MKGKKKSMTSETTESEKAEEELAQEGPKAKGSQTCPTCGGKMKRVGYKYDRTGKTVKKNDLFVCNTCKDARLGDGTEVPNMYMALTKPDYPTCNIADIVLESD